MSWAMRHEGSPDVVEGLIVEDILEGLQDGLWETTDEVRGPGETDWVFVENHPQFAELAEDLEPPPHREEDETRLDMTAMIDVTLVLLIFFILTTSYAALLKHLDAAEASNEDMGAPVVTEQQVEQQMVRVTVKEGEGGKGVVFFVEGDVVPAEKLEAKLRGVVNDKQKTTVLLEHSAEVPHGAVVHVQDAARGAGVQEIKVLIPKGELRQAQKTRPKE